MPRYRFGDFILSPRRRLLVREGREQPLIPRYFDLLVFLVEHRHEAAHRRDIFDRVWSDVVVSDSALSQAIRTIRRTLGDDSREPQFIRTISRHGYRFVYSEVVEEEDDQSWPSSEPAAQPPATGERAIDAFEPLLQTISRRAANADEEEQQREAAELLHAMGTAEALRRLGSRPGHASARALLRDSRWESAGAGSVPILSEPAPVATAQALVRLRLRRAARIVAGRWAGASVGAGLAGAAAGAMGGLILAALPGSAAPFALAAVLAVIGWCCGAAGGAGVAAGLSIAEAVTRSQRTLAVIAGASIGGGVVGFAVEWLGGATLASLVGVSVEVGGGIEGFAIGAAAGLGYAIATARIEGGLPAPRGAARARMAALTAVACGVAALLLTAAGRPLVGGTIHAIAQASAGSKATLNPLGRLVGESNFGPVSRAVIAAGEGAVFGLGLALGLTYRR